MDNQLYPNIVYPPIQTWTERLPKKGYHIAPMWDLEKGDFVRDSSNCIMTDNGYNAWTVWCIKILQTDRFFCLSYGPDIGVSLMEILKLPDHPAAEAALTREITEALYADPAGRTQYIDRIEYIWDVDSVSATITVTGMQGDTSEFTVIFPTN